MRYGERAENTVAHLLIVWPFVLLFGCAKAIVDKIRNRHRVAPAPDGPEGIRPDGTYRLIPNSKEDTRP